MQTPKVGPIKFNDIIKKYKELQHQLTGASIQIFQNMYTQVRLEDGSFGTIIDFYNKVYIQKMKAYIMSIDPRSDSVKPRSPKPKITALAPQSPLRESLPPVRLSYATIYSTRPAGTPNRPGMNTPGLRRFPMMAMTPRTKTLYAFGESATKELDRANSEIQKNSYRFQNLGHKINFGTTGSKYKNQLIQSMKQKAGPAASGKPPVGPTPGKLGKGVSFTFWMMGYSS